MKAGRNVLIAIEIFRQFFRGYTGKEYVATPHDVNVLQSLPFPKERFWFQGSYFKVFIADYFDVVNTYGIKNPSTDNMVACYRKKLLTLNLNDSSDSVKQVSHSFKYPPYEFMPLSEINDETYLNFFRANAERTQRLDWVRYYIKLRYKLYCEAEEVFAFVASRDGKILTSITLFRRGTRGDVLVFRACSIKEVHRINLFIAREFFDVLGFEELCFHALMPTSNREYLGRIEQGGNSSIIEVVEDFGDYLAITSTGKKEDFPVTPKEILQVEDFNVVRLLRGEKLED